ncbi:unnamed protein product [Symbiodinium sp. CCMP2456]|nr:unnamed protein product [Symbiodinium sp. CCMP2456]
MVSLGDVFGLGNMMYSYLSAHECAAVRAACRDSHDYLHTKALVEYLITLMQLSRPEMCSAAGAPCANEGGDSYQLQAAEAGLRSFVYGIKVWHKAWPGAMVAVVERFRADSMHMQQAIAKNARRTLTILAGYCFKNASKSVRHLLVPDTLHWLQNGEEDLRVQVCEALSKCGRHLLGRFNNACVEALLEACGSNHSVPCRIQALKALKVFAAADLGFYHVLRPQLTELYDSCAREVAPVISRMIGELDWLKIERATAHSMAQSFFSNCEKILAADPLKACSHIELERV